MTKPYKHVVLGGTFDLLHIGHKKLLTSAFKIGQHVSIGIITDSFIASKKLSVIQSQGVRKSELINYLKQKNIIKRAKLVYINDIYGPTLRKKSYEAIVVSNLTFKNALTVNKRRENIGLPKLKIIKVPLVKSDDGKEISSSRIRAGEIDQTGRSYYKLLLKITGKKLPNDIREKLKKPFSKIVKSNKSLSKKKNIITIGDISTQSLNLLKIQRKLSVVDFLTARKKTFNSLTELGFSKKTSSTIVKNPSGRISKSLSLSMSKLLKNKKYNQILLVDGEEDLAAISAVLLAPIPSTVFYGQPSRGMVMIDVDLKAKAKLCKLLNLTT